MNRIKFLIILIVLVGSLFIGVTVGKSASLSVITELSPGKIEVLSCAERGSMPIINWTAKGWMQIVRLEQTKNCVLKGAWDKSIPGLYCTGMGSLDGAGYSPDKCITISNTSGERVRKEKFRNVFSYRYLP